jgi:hypothetical protein
MHSLSHRYPCFRPQDAVLDDLLLAWATSTWPAAFDCKVELANDDGITTCVAPDGTIKQQLEHVISPLPYAVDAGLTCDITMTTNGDNVYAMEMWSQVEPSHKHTAAGPLYLLSPASSP